MALCCSSGRGQHRRGSGRRIGRLRHGGSHERVGRLALDAFPGLAVPLLSLSVSVCCMRVLDRVQGLLVDGDEESMRELHLKAATKIQAWHRAEKAYSPSSHPPPGWSVIGHSDILVRAHPRKKRSNCNENRGATLTFAWLRSGPFTGKTAETSKRSLAQKSRAHGVFQHQEKVRRRAVSRAAALHTHSLCGWCPRNSSTPRNFDSRT